MVARLENPRNLIAWFVLAGAGLSVGAWWQAGDLDVLRDQRRIWREGTVAQVRAASADEVHASGEGKAWLLRTYSYVIRAEYDVEGRAVRAEGSFATVLRSLDTRAPLELRVDPRDPLRFATSWTNERLGAAACFLAWKWSVTALWLVAMLYGALAEVKPEVVRIVDRVARDAPATPPPLAVRVLGGAALLVVATAGLGLLGVLAEDVVRRFGSYLEDALGALLGAALLALFFVATDTVRRALAARRRRA